MTLSFSAHNLGGRSLLKHLPTIHFTISRDSQEKQCLRLFKVDLCLMCHSFIGFYHFRIGYFYLQCDIGSCEQTLTDTLTSLPRAGRSLCRGFTRLQGSAGYSLLKLTGVSMSVSALKFSGQGCVKCRRRGESCCITLELPQWPL